MSKFLPKTLVLLPVIFFFASCEQKETQPSNEEAISFAKELETQINKGDGEFLDKAFDEDVFIKRMDLPKTGFAKDFSKEIFNKANFGQKICSQLTDADNITFLKHFVKEEKHHLLFRLFLSKTSALNYYDFELVKSKGKCKVADVYVYLAGQTLAESMHEMFNVIYGTAETESLSGAQLGGKLTTIRTLMKQGRSRDAKVLYDKIPDADKRTKTMGMMNVMICQQLTDDEYSQALNDYRQRFPNEPNINFMMIDGYVLQKDYRKMLGAINALDSQINKDPMLDFHRYVAYKLLEKKDSARLFLKKVIQHEPEFSLAMRSMIKDDLEDHNQAEADSLIAIYRKKKKFDQRGLDDVIAIYGNK